MKYSITKQQGRKANGIRLDGYTITTTDLFKNQPILSRKVYNGDSFKLDLVQYNRVAPMPVSSFCKIKNRAAAFNVRWEQVWKPYDAFKTGAPYAFGGQNTIPTHLPYITALDLFNLFVHSVLTGQIRRYVSLTNITTIIQSENDIKQSIDSHDFDFIYAYLNSSNTPTFFGYKLTTEGRHIYSILNLLGYRLPSYVNYDVTVLDDEIFYPNYTKLRDITYDVLPLMAYASCLVNYYTPKDKVNFAFVNSFSYVVESFPTHSQIPYSSSLPNQIATWFGALCNILSLTYYGDDYFTRMKTDLFQNANLPNAVSSPLVNEPDTEVSVGANTAPVVGNSVTSELTHIDKYLLQVMYNFTDMSMLQALSKNDIVSAAITKFGYKPEVSDMIPYLLDSVKEYIYISPEVSQADTLSSDGETGAPIGYKAGMGEGTLRLKGNYKFDKDGILLVIGSVSPDYFYYKGIPREMVSVTKDMVFDENMANVGAQAVAGMELSIDDVNILNPTSTLGFTSKYAELCQPISQLGGDFIVNSRNAGKGAFHFGRNPVNILASIASQNNALLAIQAARLPEQTNYLDGTQYDRIFISEEAGNDHIEQWNMYEITANRPCAPYGEFTIGESDGKKVDITNIGVMNN